MGINPQHQSIIIEGVKKVLGKKQGGNLSRYMQAKEAWKIRKTFNREVKSAFLMFLGILSAGFGLRGFLIPNKLVDGGTMGISLLTNRETGISLSLLILLINLPFILIAWKQISKIFSIKSIIAISLLALVVAIFPYPVITQDKLLIAVFGGFF